ncbi:sensor histidine kinase, partial [Streptomyces sp. Ru87]|uniref:sensor histidine kinase n=1 Tax=Streptomyces sp. Ru87 TaxID=2044307 RepID=UPI00211D5011
MATPPRTPLRRLEERLRRLLGPGRPRRPESGSLRNGAGPGPAGPAGRGDEGRAEGPERFTDAATALGIAFVVAVGTALSMRGKAETPEQTLAGWLLVVVGCAALYWRRTRPVTVAAVTLAVCAVYYPVSEYDGPLMIVFVVALYSAIVADRFGAAVALSVFTMVAVAYGETLQDPDDRQVDDASLFMLGGWLLSVLAIGRAQLTRNAYLHEAEQRALAAEREQEARAVQGATEERLRIARELHDVLGHSISLINVQSSAALHRLTKRPGDPAQLEPAERALEAVKATSKDALRELRATLGLLRQVDEAAPTTPAGVGLDRLPELVERARAGGLEIRTRVEGVPGDVRQGLLHDAVRGQVHGGRQRAGTGPVATALRAPVTVPVTAPVPL